MNKEDKGLAGKIFEGRNPPNERDQLSYKGLDKTQVGIRAANIFHTEANGGF